MRLHAYPSVLSFLLFLLLSRIAFETALQIAALGCMKFYFYLGSGTIIFHNLAYLLG